MCPTWRCGKCMTATGQDAVGTLRKCEEVRVDFADETLFGRTYKVIAIVPHRDLNREITVTVQGIVWAKGQR